MTIKVRLKIHLWITYGYSNVLRQAEFFPSEPSVNLESLGFLINGLLVPKMWE
jgi:hypothetical protein